MGSIILFFFFFLNSHTKNNLFFLKKNQFVFFISLILFNYICAQMSVHKFSKFFLYKYTIISFFINQGFTFLLYNNLFKYLLYVIIYMSHYEYSVEIFKKILILLIFLPNNIFFFLNFFFLKKKSHTIVNLIYFLFFFFFTKIFSNKYILSFILKSKISYIKILDIIVTNFKVKVFNGHYYQLFNYKPVFFLKKYYNFNFNGFLNFLKCLTIIFFTKKNKTYL